MKHYPRFKRNLANEVRFVENTQVSFLIRSATGLRGEKMVQVSRVTFCAQNMAVKPLDRTITSYLVRKTKKPLIGVLIGGAPDLVSWIVKRFPKTLPPLNEPQGTWLSTRRKLHLKIGRVWCKVKYARIAYTPEIGVHLFLLVSPDFTASSETSTK